MDFVYIDEDHKLIYVNDRFVKSPDTLKRNCWGWASWNWVHKKNVLKTKPKSFFFELADGKTVRWNATFKVKWWTHLCTNVRDTYFDDREERIGSMIVFADIHALKSAQELLKREEGYRTFIDQSAVGIWRAEYRQPIPVTLPLNEQVELLGFRIIAECNDFMARMYGYSSSNDLVGRKIRDFYYIENNYDEEKTRELLTSFIKNNYKISNAESKELDLYGSVRFMLNNNIGIVEQGHLVRTWGVQTDITDRKRTEKELLETNQELDTFFYKSFARFERSVGKCDGNSQPGATRKQRWSDRKVLWYGGDQHSRTRLDTSWSDRSCKNKKRNEQTQCDQY